MNTSKFPNHSIPQFSVNSKKMGSGELCGGLCGYARRAPGSFQAGTHSLPEKSFLHGRNCNQSKNAFRFDNSTSPPPCDSTALVADTTTGPAWPSPIVGARRGTGQGKNCKDLKIPTGKNHVDDCKDRQPVLRTRKTTTNPEQISFGQALKPKVAQPCVRPLGSQRVCFVLLRAEKPATQDVTTKISFGGPPQEDL